MALVLISTALCVWSVHTTPCDNFLQWTWEPAATDEPEDHHYLFGEALGRAFPTEIQSRINNSWLTNTLIPEFASGNASAPGTAIYEEFLKNNNATYPDYMNELQGLAHGAKVPFAHLFLSQMHEEFTYFVQKREPKPVLASVEHCSDVIWKDSNCHAYIAHNEDSDQHDIGHVVLVHAPSGVGGSVPFSGFTYLGNLPTGAFGYNPHVLFTLNYMHPLKGQRGGLGRTFMARDVLCSTSAADALARATRPGIGGGHNYQILGWEDQRLMNVEVAAFGRSAVQEMTSASPDAYFHANVYRLLQHEGDDSSGQLINDSAHRQARASELLRQHPIKKPTDLLRILGDQADASVGYPIFHDNYSHHHGDLGGWTLASILVNGPNKTISFWDSNPKTTDSCLTLAAYP